MINEKIKSLVNKGYKEAAFIKKENAKKFSSELRKQGYKTGTLRSTGPTVEGKYGKAYYVIGEEPTIIDKFNSALKKVNF
jgi:uncharacterized protein YaaQ